MRTCTSGASSTSSRDLGVLDDTAILISRDHGETLGELNIYATTRPPTCTSRIFR